jgi:hypothetical protein
MSSTLSGPFLKENDVSRQVGKSIYAENQVYDGQTQRTEQAMELFAAVRAEHTVIESTEEPFTSLNPIASSHFKETPQDSSYNTLVDPDSCYNKWLAHLGLPLLPHPQTLYSFLEHIYPYNYTPLNLYNFTLAISIKLDYSECLIHLSNDPEPLSDYFIPQRSGYGFYPSIPIPSKYSPILNHTQYTKPVLEDNAVNYTYPQLVATVLSGQDDTVIANEHYGSMQLHTCYNKFLAYNHLLLLPHPQTIISFLRHIYSFDYLPSNACDYTLTISIKNDYSEAHVYLPSDPKPLPNHFIPPLQAIWHYPNILLKSDTTENNFLNLTNPYSTILTPNSLSFTSSIPPQQPLPISTSAFSPPTSLSLPTQTPISMQNLRDLHLNIATHNVRGFNTITKKEAWQNYCLYNNIDIACITETKIANTTNLHFCNNNQFTYFWANSENSAEGAAIMIRNYLQPHIHNCQTHPGGAIALDLFFKSEVKLRIIAVYLSSTDTHRRNKTQETVISWIQQAHQLNLHPIILGDFNTHDDICSSSSKFRLTNYLHQTNMYDLGAHVDNKHYTWSNNNSQSRIDYIWTDSFNLQFFISYSLDDSSYSTSSDHSILLSSWSFTNAFSKPPRYHTGISRRIFNYKAMSPEKWTEFSDMLSQKLNSHNTPLDHNTNESIETTWHKIEHSIIYSAIHSIPNKKSRKRSYNHKYSPHSTLLHLSLKELGHLIKIVKNPNNNLNINPINSKIQNINKRSNCDLQILSSNQQPELKQWIQHAQDIWKQLYHA